MTAGWGRSTARGSRRTPAWKPRLDVHESSQVKKSLAQMRGQPDEVAVHGVHRIVHREGGLAGQVADPVLVHEAVFGGHAMFLIGRWDNTSRAAWTPGSRLIRRGSSSSPVQRTARSFEVGVAPGAVSASTSVLDCPAEMTADSEGACTITAKDQHGNIVEDAVLEFSCDVGDSECAISEEGVVTITTPSAGPIDIKIYFGDESVGNAQVNLVKVDLDSALSRISCVNKNEIGGTLRAGDTVSCKLILKDAGGDQVGEKSLRKSLLIHVTMEDGEGDHDILAEESSDGTKMAVLDWKKKGSFDFDYVPTVAGQVTFTAYYAKSTGVPQLLHANFMLQSLSCSRSRATSRPRFSSAAAFLSSSIIL